MSEAAESKRTLKGEQARQRILESALTLFASKGYEETTMREIAAQAGYSPGLTYRYFASKEELVLQLYRDLCAELDQFTHDLTVSSLPERFQVLITKQLELMAPHREALSALFGTALNARSNVGVFGKQTTEIRRRARLTYREVIAGAKDAPKAAQHDDLATVLYAMHMGMILFWLIDESRDTSRTWRLIAFLRDMLKLLLPILWLPPVAHALVRLAAILGPMFGKDESLDET
ncbi:TetR family transcriptional regulator [Thermosporothrix hazakensis]|jgi:AcrR family transcriptional regulator|uniref:TetR family transcriptional regulator n=1 Tax=Thermosporothrix hazakensis TaxID=644383 RepID=A0A326U8A4_THEHA|nr:TetR/AcrR family transcriptional regulator [Thermosporothrix hazakensis]PZW31298.1 TetR family transcriptional regulator [Thermosporothrix hazakensis]GCE50790.1 TetR family transcriptional regulator [Thermosporothrix hazakensis]